MKRSEIKRSTKPMKRATLRQRSKHREEIMKERERVLVAHFGARNSWRCIVRDNPSLLAVMGRCIGKVNAHEVKSRSRAGRTDANLLDVKNMKLLCNYHNTWVEDHPLEALRVGLAKHAWED